MIRLIAKPKIDWNYDVEKKIMRLFTFLFLFVQNGNQLGDLTREKFERLGNAEAVQRTFQQELPFNELSKWINGNKYVLCMNFLKTKLNIRENKQKPNV